MTNHPRSGLFGFLLLLAALAPAGALAQAASPLEAAPGSIDARLRRISQAMGPESPDPEPAEGRAKAPDGRLAYVFVNGGGPRFGWGNGGFRNGGWGNGGFRNGGFRNFW